ncbi:MAG: helix-turn-helix transcriptional regulator [Treponema sp.]|nr:helix-turn-helix transcriptional regulator [Treponema sp.]
MGFAENLRDELEYQGMQVKELAEKTGLSINTLNKYRSGSTVVPTVDNAAKIAKTLNVSLDYLVTGTNSEMSEENAIDVQSLARKLRRFSQNDVQLVTALIDSMSEKYV